MGLADVYSKLCLTGNGVNVVLVELNIPGPVITDTGELEELGIDLNDITVVETDNSPISPDINTPDKKHSHSYNTFRVMAGSQTGIAKNINMYATNNKLENIEKLLSYDIDIINANYARLIYDRIYSDTKDVNSSYSTNPKFSYELHEKYFDHVVSQHNITVVVAGGNWGDHENDWFDTSLNDNGEVKGWTIGARVTSPGMAYNVITVGGYNNNNTGDIEADDFLVNYG